MNKLQKRAEKISNFCILLLFIGVAVFVISIVANIIASGFILAGVTFSGFILFLTVGCTAEYISKTGKWPWQ